jgi:predicted amidohydrolase
MMRTLKVALASLVFVLLTIATTHVLMRCAKKQVSQFCETVVLGDSTEDVKARAIERGLPMVVSQRGLTVGSRTLWFSSGRCLMVDSKGVITYRHYSDS